MARLVQLVIELEWVVQWVIRWAIRSASMRMGMSQYSFTGKASCKSIASIDSLETFIIVQDLINAFHEVKLSTFLLLVSFLIAVPTWRLRSVSAALNIIESREAIMQDKL